MFNYIFMLIMFAIMQHAFGLEVTGLLKGDDVYSNYWNYNLF